MSSDNAWLTKFVVTPHISHAVEVLRSAVPQRDGLPPGAGYVTIYREGGRMRSEAFIILDDPEETREEVEVVLTDEQKAAASFLLDVAIYYESVIGHAYPEDEDTLEPLTRLDVDVTKELDLIFALLNQGSGDYLSIFG